MRVWLSRVTVAVPLPRSLSQDTITGFLLAGVGDASAGQPNNYMVVDQGARATAPTLYVSPPPLSVSPPSFVFASDRGVRARACVRRDHAGGDRGQVQGVYHQ